MNSHATLCHFMKRLIPCIVAAFLVLPLAAQETTKAESKGRLIRFAAFGLPSDDTEYVLSANGEPGDVFKIPGNGFTLPIPLPTSDSGTVLGVPVAPKAGEDGPGSKPLVKLSLPKAGKRFLGIILPGADKKLRSIIINADDPGFRPGNVMVLNLSPETIAAELGDEKLLFRPASRTVFKPTRKGDLANYQVAFYHSKDGKPKRFAASLWPYFDKKRAFVFFFVDPENGRPTYRSIDEFTEWLGKAK
jgi:hypothetical protein